MKAILNASLVCEDCGQVLVVGTDNKLRGTNEDCPCGGAVYELPTVDLAEVKAKAAKAEPALVAAAAAVEPDTVTVSAPKKTSKRK